MELWRVRFQRTEHFINDHPQASPAKWLKDTHECAPTQTANVICRTLESVDIECRSPRAEGVAKRAKKL
jgi:hypothetical protein